MSFGQAVKSAFRQYATFSGRASRSEFWWFYLATNIFAFVLIGVPYILFFIAIASTSSGSGSSSMPPLGWISLILLGIGFLAMLAFTLPTYAVMARRLHDLGQPAHWVFLNLAGLGIVPLVMCIQEGNAYDNQYGPVPEGGARNAGGYSPQAYAQPPYPAYPAQPGYAAPPAYPAQPGYPAQPAYPAYPAQPGYPAQPAVPPPYAPPAAPGVGADPFTTPGN